MQGLTYVQLLGRPVLLPIESAAPGKNWHRQSLCFPALLQINEIHTQVQKNSFQISSEQYNWNSKMQLLEDLAVPFIFLTEVATAGYCNLASRLLVF